MHQDYRHSEAWMLKQVQHDGDVDFAHDALVGLPF
jgi:hypothetical protein